MIINIAFDPQNLKPEDEAYPAFQAGGMTLKIWALWKKSFITSQNFKLALERLAEHYESMFDADNHEVMPYANIDEFVDLMSNSGLSSFAGEGPLRHDLAKWAMKYWDYFNPVIQRSITLEYSAIREVREQINIEGIKHVPAEPKSAA